MKHIRLISLTIIAILSLGAFAVASASAEELTKMLPEATPTNPVTFNATSGKGQLDTTGFLKFISCESDTAKASAISANLGTFDVLFLKCKSSLGAECKGLVDTVAGSILSVGTFHFWLAEKGGKLFSVIVYLPTETHIECGTSQLILVKGCVAGTVSPIEKLTTKTTVKLAETSQGHNEITLVLPQETTKQIACELKSQENGGTLEQGGEVTEEENTGYTQGGKAIEVLLMH